MEAKDAAGRGSWRGGIPFPLKRPLLRSCPETKSLTVRNLITPSRSTIQPMPTDRTLSFSRFRTAGVPARSSID